MAPHSGGAVGTPASPGSGPEDKALLTPTPVKESERLRHIRLREERGDTWVPGLPKSAAEALRTAMRWQAEIGGGLRRADVARRERLFRARVTQIMSLLDLPDDLQNALLDGSSEKESWSVRRALREVG